MANESICSHCGGDATRCGCPSAGVPWVDPELARQARIERNQREIDRLVNEIRDLPPRRRR